MVALVSLDYQLIDLPSGNLRENTVAFADRDEDGVQHIIDTANDLGIRACKLFRLASLGQLSLLGGFGETLQFLLQTLLHFDDPNQTLGHRVVFRTNIDLDRQVALGDGLGRRRLLVDRVDGQIEVVLDGVKVAVVRIGDLGRDVAFGNIVHVISGNVQRPNHRIQRFIDPFDDLAEIALVFGRIGACGQTTFDSGYG